MAVIIAQPLAAREVVDAAAPSDIAVTIYRAPDRSADERLERADPRGFAMISETRRVTLPAGETTIRFEGVAEGMIGVSAIVTGLPGGTIEKNRNAALLSPAALVDGSLGNRVSITRTNPATGAEVREDAVVRTRADGGLVLQTAQGFEAIRCAGLPEGLSFVRVPAGLSAKPVFTVDTRSDAGGIYDVTLTYLAWGFDWQANYVGTFKQQGGARSADGTFGVGLLSWLTLVNDNGQSFDGARLQIVAGRLNVESDYQDLAEPPVAAPLRLTCYPLGSTAEGIPVDDILPPPPPPLPPAMMASPIMMEAARMPATIEMITSEDMAREENLGDLKLFRVPGRVDVSARGIKQVAFLNQDNVRARLLYRATCLPDSGRDAQALPVPAEMLMVTKNEDRQGLGMALPQGVMTLYEPVASGERLAGRTTLRDYARGQEVELDLARSAQVFSACAVVPRPVSEGGEGEGAWTAMATTLTNANPHAVKLRLQLGYAGRFAIRFPGARVVVKDGWQTVEVTVPANSEKRLDWQLRSSLRPRGT